MHVLAELDTQDLGSPDIRLMPCPYPVNFSSLSKRFEYQFQ